MKIDITIYNGKQYTSKGLLKKKAVSEHSFTFFDIEPINEADKPRFIKEVAEKIKAEYTDFESPYIFTCIKATNKATGERVFIHERVEVGGNSFITSPTELLNLLKQ